MSADFETSAKPIAKWQRDQALEKYGKRPEDFTGDGVLFMLRVRGESMIEAGIFDGDYIFVKKQLHADDGQIVVAMIENEATVKRIYREGERVRFQPSNDRMKPIYVYQRDFLLGYSGLPVGPLEQAERLEQLRALENGHSIRVVETEYESLGVDTPADLERVSQLFEASLESIKRNG